MVAHYDELFAGGSVFSDSVRLLGVTLCSTCT